MSASELRQWAFWTCPSDLGLAAQAYAFVVSSDDKELTQRIVERIPLNGPDSWAAALKFVEGRDA